MDPLPVLIRFISTGWTHCLVCEQRQQRATCSLCSLPAPHRVWGVGCQVQHVGCRAQGAGCGAQRGLCCVMWGPSCMERGVRGAGCQLSVHTGPVCFAGVRFGVHGAG